MGYVLRYRLFPDEVQREQLDWVRNTVRQLSNHALHRFNRIPETEGTVKQRVTQVRNEIPDLKEWWTDISNIYSTVLQQAVEQIATNIVNLGKLKQQGFDVGSLNWKDRLSIGVSRIASGVSNLIKRVATTDMEH